MGLLSLFIASSHLIETQHKQNTTQGLASTKSGSPGNEIGTFVQILILPGAAHSWGRDVAKTTSDRVPARYKFTAR